MRSYLFNSVINVSAGPEEEREMLTGVHVVRDIYCISCQSNVGWKYVRPHALPRLPPSLARSCTSSAEDEMFVRAFVFSAQVTAYEESQKYKEGRFIIEKVHMQKDSSWGRAVRVPSVPAAAEG